MKLESFCCLFPVFEFTSSSYTWVKRICWIQIFIKINLGGEKQKSGIDPSNLEVFYKNCLDLKLNIIGTMCIPPDNQDPKPFFKEMLNLKHVDDTAFEDSKRYYQFNPVAVCGSIIN